MGLCRPYPQNEEMKLLLPRALLLLSLCLSAFSVRAALPNGVTTDTANEAQLESEFRAGNASDQSSALAEARRRWDAGTLSASASEWGSREFRIQKQFDNIAKRAGADHVQVKTVAVPPAERDLMVALHSGDSGRRSGAMKEIEEKWSHGLSPGAKLEVVNMFNSLNGLPPGNRVPEGPMLGFFIDKIAQPADDLGDNAKSAEAMLRAIEQHPRWNPMARSYFYGTSMTQVVDPKAREGFEALNRLSPKFFALKPAPTFEEALRFLWSGAGLVGADGANWGKAQPHASKFMRDNMPKVMALATSPHEWMQAAAFKIGSKVEWEALQERIIRENFAGLAKLNPIAKTDRAAPANYRQVEPALPITDETDSALRSQFRSLTGDDLETALARHARGDYVPVVKVGIAPAPPLAPGAARTGVPRGVLRNAVVDFLAACKRHWQRVKPGGHVPNPPKRGGLSGSKID